MNSKLLTTAACLCALALTLALSGPGLAMGPTSKDGIAFERAKKAVLEDRKFIRVEEDDGSDGQTKAKKNKNVIIIHK